MVVSALWLWESAIKDSQANRPFQKLQRNFLLILQLLLLLILIFALTRPFLTSDQISANNLIVIIDASASMKSTDVSKSRFDLAKEKATTIIDGLGENQKIMIISAALSPKVVASFSSDKIFLKKSLHDLKPYDVPAKLKDATVLALSLLGRGNGEIYIFSDKGSNDLLELENATIPIHYISIGGKSSNIAITALDVRYNPVTNQDFQVFTAVSNFYPEQKDFNLELYVDDNLIDVQSLSLGANSRKAQIFQLGSLFQGGLVRVQLDIEDDLKVDNRAYSFVPKNITKKILLVSEDNFFLEKALNVDPNLQIHKIAPKLFESFDISPYQAIVLDGFSPEMLPFANYIFIHALPPQLTISGYASQPTIIDWDTENPITRFVDFSDVAIEKSMKINPNNFTRPILFSDDAPLIWTFDDQKTKGVIIDFDLYDSNFPLKVGFPIFISNAINWLSEASQGAFTGNIKTGDAYRIIPPEKTKKVIIQSPNGREVEYTKEQFPIYFQQTETSGLYQIAMGDSTGQFAANLLDEDESSIKPEKSIQLGESTVATSSYVSTKKEIWRYLAFLALIILMAEWYFYHKKPM